MDEDIRLFREAVRKLQTYRWWDERGGLKVLSGPRHFAWKDSKKGKLKHTKKEAPALLRIALETVFWEYLLGEPCALKDQQETIRRIARNKFDGKPAFGGKLSVGGQALGDQAPGPRFRHLWESYKALRESVGEQNRAIEDALKKWEQKVRTRLVKEEASKWNGELSTKKRQQYLVREIDKSIGCYTNLTKGNRASHIQKLLELFEVPDVPDADSIGRTLLRAK